MTLRAQENLLTLSFEVSSSDCTCEYSQVIRSWNCVMKFNHRSQNIVPVMKFCILYIFGTRTRIRINAFEEKMGKNSLTTVPLENIVKPFNQNVPVS